tara:strand:- start:334 stop:2163 length:1830 start_codon:yes stop_codon:yes gene_type:complete
MDLYSILFDLNKENLNKNELTNVFKLPIEYLNDKILLSDNIINDLELKELKELKDDNISENVIDLKTDNSDNIYKKNLYYSLLNPENLFEKQIVNKWSNYYTNNKDYLLETQNLLKTFKNNIYIAEDNNIFEEDEIYDDCENIFYDKGFIEKFQYFDLPFLNKFNNDSNALTFLSMYNLSSPLINLLIPIISLIIPFIIIKIQGYPISVELYIEYLKSIFENQAIGQLFINFSEQPLSSKVYIILSVLFYFFQIYQNILNCKKYFANIKFIHNILFKIKNYLNFSINNINNLFKYTNVLTTYKEFNNTINTRINILIKYKKKLEYISDYNINFKKTLEMGNIMNCFYMLNNDKELIETLYYSFNLNGYIKNIINIQKLIKNDKINYCNFEKEKKTEFKNAFYGFLLNDVSNSNVIVKNSYDLSNNLILTGPNAAGKTTLLKTTLFNIIVSQQIGCGFYENANIQIYDFIHCYLNIPDTSNRDSLFQAEARQCKEILNLIEENKEKKHFCVFDELYSGTNPEEAVKSGYNYLKYLNKIKNVDYLLTTHYYKLCKKMDKTENNINNFHMEIKKTKEDFICSYKIKKGISKVKGGLKILKDFNYPKEIINNK